jgi:hypothetical protein
MCELKALNNYQTSQELMMDLNRCLVNCPSRGTLLSSPADCPMYKQALNRNLELLQQEEAVPKVKKKEISPELITIVKRR